MPGRGKRDLVRDSDEEESEPENNIAEDAVMAEIMANMIHILLKEHQLGRPVKRSQLLACIKTKLENKKASEQGELMTRMLDSVGRYFDETFGYKIAMNRTGNLQGHKARANIEEKKGGEKIYFLEFSKTPKAEMAPRLVKGLLAEITNKARVGSEAHEDGPETEKQGLLRLIWVMMDLNYKHQSENYPPTNDGMGAHDVPWFRRDELEYLLANRLSIPPGRITAAVESFITAKYFDKVSIDRTDIDSTVGEHMPNPTNPATYRSQDAQTKVSVLRWAHRSELEMLEETKFDERKNYEVRKGISEAIAALAPEGSLPPDEGILELPDAKTQRLRALAERMEPIKERRRAIVSQTLKGAPAEPESRGRKRGRGESDEDDDDVDLFPEPKRKPKAKPKPKPKSAKPEPKGKVKPEPKGKGVKKEVKVKAERRRAEVVEVEESSSGEEDEEEESGSGSGSESGSGESGSGSGEEESGSSEESGSGEEESGSEAAEEE